MTRRRFHPTRKRVGSEVHHAPQILVARVCDYFGWVAAHRLLLQEYQRAFFHGAAHRHRAHAEEGLLSVQFGCSILLILPPPASERWPIPLVQYRRGCIRSCIPQLQPQGGPVSFQKGDEARGDLPTPQRPPHLFICLLHFSGAVTYLNYHTESMQDTRRAEKDMRALFLRLRLTMHPTK